MDFTILPPLVPQPRAHRAAVDSRIRMHYERLSHSPAHISRPLSGQNVCATPARLRYRFPMLAQRRATLYCDWWTQVAPSLAHRWLLMLTLFSNFLISSLPSFPLLRSPSPWWTIVVSSNPSGPADGTKIPRARSNGRPFEYRSTPLKTLRAHFWVYFSNFYEFKIKIYEFIIEDGWVVRILTKIKEGSIHRSR